MIRLEEVTKEHIQFLYDVLAERRVADSISHKRHPTFEEHRSFVLRKPYLGWYVIADGDELLGTCYITHYREVGIWLMPNAQGKGAGKAAMQQLLSKYPGRLFTNTSIFNGNAKAFYEKCGFRHCAHMLEHDNVPASGSHSTGKAVIDALAPEGSSDDWQHTLASVDLTRSETRFDRR